MEVDRFSQDSCEAGDRMRDGEVEFPLDQDALAASVDGTKESWRSEFERLGREMGPARIPGRGDPDDLLDDLAEYLARSIDQRVPGRTPPESLRWNAMSRVLSLLCVRSLKKAVAYSADKNANDAFDFNLLQYLAVPAAICTQDQALIRNVRASRSWQAEWVVDRRTCWTPACADA